MSEQRDVESHRRQGRTAKVSLQSSGGISLVRVSVAEQERGA